MLRFVERKTPKQQSRLMLERIRHLVVRQFDAITNAKRALLEAQPRVVAVGGFWAPRFYMPTAGSTKMIQATWLRSISCCLAKILRTSLVTSGRLIRYPWTSVQPSACK